MNLYWVANVAVQALAIWCANPWQVFVDTAVLVNRVCWSF